MIAKDRFFPLWAYGLILMACLGSYAMSLSNGYTLDDYLVNSSNPYVREGIKGIDDIFSNPMSTYQGKGFEFRPLATATFAIEHELFGENPHLSHGVNLMIYTLCCLFLYQTLQRLKLWPGTYWALVTVVIFAIHPLHTEVVNSLKNRDEMFAFLFSVMALRCMLVFLEKHKWVWLLLGGLAISVAIFAKVSAIPVVLLIPFVLWYLRKVNARKASLIFTVLFAFGWARNLWMNIKMGGNLERVLQFYENPLYVNSSLLDHLGSAFGSLFFYFKMSFFPYPLVSYYGFDQAPDGSWTSLETQMGMVLTALFAGLLYFRRKKRDRLNLGILIWLISILPYTNLLMPAPGIVAERFAFLSVLGFAMTLSGFVQVGLIFKSGNKVQFALATVVFCLLVIGYNNYRSSQWKDSLTLFEADIVHAENSVKLQFMLAEQYLQESNRQTGADKAVFQQRALKAFKKAFANDSSFTNAANATGLLYYNQLNKPQEAIAYFKAALRLEPANADLMYNLASAYRETGDSRLAATLFAKSMQNGRSDYLTHAQLSRLLMQLGEYESVITINRHARFKDREGQLLAFIGLAQLHKGDSLNALKNFERAFELNPDSEALETRINSLRQSFRGTK